MGHVGFEFPFLSHVFSFANQTTAKLHREASVATPCRASMYAAGAWWVFTPSLPQPIWAFPQVCFYV